MVRICVGGRGGVSKRARRFGDVVDIVNHAHVLTVVDDVACGMRGRGTFNVFWNVFDYVGHGVVLGEASQPVVLVLVQVRRLRRVVMVVVVRGLLELMIFVHLNGVTKNVFSNKNPNNFTKTLLNAAPDSMSHTTKTFCSS